MPFAVVIRSGTMPSWSQANQSPVRQKPVWISSATNTIPLSSQNFLIAERQGATVGYSRLRFHGSESIAASNASKVAVA